MKRASGILAILGAALLSIAMLLTAVDGVAMNKEFYHDKQAELRTAAFLGISETDLQQAMNALLDYIGGDRENIRVTINIAGREATAFDAQESAHMVDVRSLYQRAMRIRDLLIFIPGILFVFAVLIGKMPIRDLFKNVVIGMLTGTFIIGIVAVAAASNFDWFWTTFHELIFTNDLWLLDPSNSLMINILPSELFYALVMLIVVVYLVCVVLVCIVCAAGMAVIGTVRRSRQQGEAGHYRER